MWDSCDTVLLSLSSPSSSVVGYEVLTDVREKVLTNLGEKMTDDEVDELLKVVDTSSGEINYTGLSSPFLSVRLMMLTMGVMGRPCPDYPRKLIAPYIPIPLPSLPSLRPN